MGLKTIFSRVDRLTGIGEYGVLFLGLNDVSNTQGCIRPVNMAKNLKLLYVKPFSQKTARINLYEQDPKNPRYGLPLSYFLEIYDVHSGASQTIEVHYSRIIHIVEDNMESEIIGTPRLQPVYNRLMDLEKVVGADSEMYWRGARPGFQGLVDKEFQMTPEVEDKMMEQFDEYEHHLRRYFTMQGAKLEELRQQIADPTSHVQVCVQMISSQTGIPARVLMGSERGELASTQDSSEWLTHVQARREDFAEPCIIRKFVDRLLELKILPSPKDDYTVDWSDLFSISEKSRVEIGKGRSNSLREYTTNPMAEAVLPPDAFLEVCLGLSTEQITLIKKMRDEAMGGEVDDFIKAAIESTITPAANPNQPANTNQPADTNQPANTTKSNPAVRTKTPVKK